MMCPFVNIEVLAVSDGTTYDDEGYPIETYEVVETLTNIDRQPASGEISEKKYGVTDRDCTDELYIFKKTMIKNASKLRIGTDLYEVRRVLDWGPCHKEVIIKPYNGSLVVV